MARLITTNAAATILAASLGGTSEDTTVALATGTGDIFPALPYAGDYFSGVLINSSNQYEIVRVTARTSDSLTVVRGQEGTTIRSFSASDRFEHRLTASDIQFMQGSYWSRESAAVARVDGTHFTVVGDKTAVYTQYRAVRAIQTTTGYGFVVSSSYSSGTGLTTVVVESLTVDSGLAAIEYGQDPTSAPKYGAYPTASTSTSGVARFATDAETTTGTDATIAVTPAGLASQIGSTLQAYDAATVKTDEVQGSTATKYPVPLSITSSSNALAHDNATCQLATCALGENSTVGVPSNMVAGEAGELQVTPSGSYTLAFNSSGWAMADGTSISVTPASGKVTRILWRCNGTKNIIYKVIQEA